MSLHCGDNLPILKSLPSESVDLVYLDPPFNSGRNYFQSDKQAFTDTWQWSDESESLLDGVGLTALVEFVGRNGLSAYLVMMAVRLAELHRVLKPTGSLYLHCDPTASHYLKLVLDAVFCPQGGDYKNEIVWCYGSGGASKKHFSKKHDVIFFYSKSNSHIFNVDCVREPYSSPHESRLRAFPINYCV
jgi:site-specific DNA-methyltransferase (adenine-specific)